MSKINLDTLKQLLSEGKTQADCSRHFQVSEVAVSKAVKRLKASALPASMEKLTKKEKEFVLCLAEGKSPTEAAVCAYDCKDRQVARVLGNKMNKEIEISTALADIMAQEGIPRRRRIQRLGDLIESSDLSAVSRGLDMSWKLDGSYAPVEVNATVDVRALLAEIRAERELLQKQLDDEA